MDGLDRLLKLDHIYLINNFNRFDDVLRYVCRKKNVLNLLAFPRSMKHMKAGLVYSIDFPLVCLITNKTSEHDHPDRYPYKSRAHRTRCVIELSLRYLRRIIVAFDLFESHHLGEGTQELGF